MAVRFLPQVLPQAPGALNFAPVANALDGIRQQQQQNMLMEQRQAEFGAQQEMQRNQLAAAAGRHSSSMAQRKAEFEAQQELARERMAAENAYRNATLAQRRAEFEAGAPLRSAQAELARGRVNDAKRAAELMKRLNIDPNSPEGIALATTGKLPASAYKSMEADRKRQESGAKIAAGLKDVMQKAEAANKAGSLESAIGPFQGTEPSTMLGNVPIGIARAWGEVTNLFGGGKMSPTEVRSNISGATEAIAASIKPLIRLPGEGPWTDADQARLVAMVGNLPEAKNLQEFKRRLNALRDRVQANFGMSIPFDAMQPMPKSGLQPPSGAVEMLRNNPTPRMRAAFEAKYGKGSARRVLGRGAGSFSPGRMNGG